MIVAVCACVSAAAGLVLVHMVRNARQAKVINSWRGVYHTVPAATAGGG